MQESQRWWPTSARRFVNDLSDLNRVIHSGLTLNREWVELAQIVEQAVELVGPALSARGHDLQVDVAVGLLLHVDPARIVQVIANLVMNAVKYTDADGLIGISARCIQDEVVLCVRDNGIGIPPEVLPKVFEMFVRGPRAQGRSDGVGLGLYIVKALVRQHGGAIEARSDGPGRGSEFIVRLPCGSARA